MTDRAVCIRVSVLRCWPSCFSCWEVTISIFVLLVGPSSLPIGCRCSGLSVLAGIWCSRSLLTTATIGSWCCCNSSICWCSISIRCRCGSWWACSSWILAIAIVGHCLSNSRPSLSTICFICVLVHVRACVRLYICSLSCCASYDSNIILL